MKIAIATDDQKTIALRMGRAKYFGIFEVENKEIKSFKFVINEHASSHDHDHDHHEEHNKEEVNKHAKDIQVLKECDFMIAKAVGPNMKDALKTIKLEIIKISKLNKDSIIDTINKIVSENNL
jgi:predicted Fe-Mo cluster-binding NifX family protein